MDLADIRDLAIVIWGGLFAVALIVIIIATIVLAVAIKGLIGVVKNVVNEDVRETLSKARDTAENVRGATAFVTDSAVSPVIKVYSTVSAAKQFVRTITGRGRKKRRFGVPFRR